MKIVKEQLEFNEIYKGKVKPIATGGYIPFFKRFIGRIVHIIIPNPEKAYWMFNKSDLIKLKEAVNKLEFPQPYSKQKKEEMISSIEIIQKNMDGFDLDILKTLIERLENEKLDKVSKNLIVKIRKSYSI